MAKPGSIHTAACILLLIVVGLVAYRSSFAGVFVLDDGPAIVHNPNIRGLWPLSRAMSAPPEVTVAARPVVSLTLALNHALAPPAVRDVFEARPGDPPEVQRRFLDNLWGYHALNLAVHLLAALTLFAVVRRTLAAGRHQTAGLKPGRAEGSVADRPEALALLIALVWVVHPLQTASVTYIVQRAESLMGLFYLLTMYCAIRALGAARPPVWIAAAIAACAMGMGCKEAMITAPAAVWLWDWTFVRSGNDPRVSPGTRRWLYAGLAATWLIVAWLMLNFPRSHSVGFSFAEWPWWRYLFTQAGVILHYLRLAIVPWPLALDYGWPPARAISEIAPQTALLAALLGLIGWAVWRRRPDGFAGAWFFLILAPTSSVVPVATEIAAEHRMYLPLAAVVSVVVIAGYRLVRRAGTSWARVAGLATSATVIVALAVLTGARNREYWSEERLWADTVETRPENPRARANYGAALQTAGRSAEAESQLRIADGLEPGDGQTQATLGVVLASQSRFPEAIARLERAATLRPEDAEVEQNLAEAYASAGRPGEALGHYLRALELRPDDPFLLNRAGWILATSPLQAVRDGHKAAALAQRAVELTSRRDVISLDTLAAADAEIDRFDQAVVIAREALALAHAGNEGIVPELSARLAMYEQGRKFRQ